MSHAPDGAAGAAPPAVAAGDADDVTPGEKSWHYVCELAATAYPGDDPWKELHEYLVAATSSAPDMLHYHDFLKKNHRRGYATLAQGRRGVQTGDPRYPL